MRTVKSKLKKWLIRGAIIGGTIALIGYCSRDFWTRQIRIYAFGLAEVRADEFGYSLPDVDEIEIMALGGLDITAPDGPDRIAHYQITGRTVLRGEDTKKVAQLWRYLPRGRVFSAMCHDPAYALGFRQGGKLLFETTVCWACQNYTIPIGVFGRIEYGFDSKTKEAQNLLELLQSHVPLPKKPNA